MSSYQLSAGVLTPVGKRVPMNASFSPPEDVLAVLWESGYVELYDLHTRVEPGRKKVMAPTLTWNGNIGTVPSCRQVTVTAGAFEESLARISVLGSDHGGVDVVTVVELEKESSVNTREIKMPHCNGRLVASDGIVLWQAPDGQIFEGEMLLDDSMKQEVLTSHIPVVFLDKQTSHVASFPEFCFSSSCAAAPPTPGVEGSTWTTLFAGLSNSGKLYIASTSVTRLLASNVNSFCIASGFVIFATTAHEAHFAPLITLSSILTKSGEADDNVALPEFEKRRVERGSRIVTSVPSTMSLILQMPRGNLETINPRPLVMEVVKKDLDA
jgi:elongator complex protein 1